MKRLSVARCFLFVLSGCSGASTATLTPLQDPNQSEKVAGDTTRSNQTSQEQIRTATGTTPVTSGIPPPTTPPTTEPVPTPLASPSAAPVGSPAPTPVATPATISCDSVSPDSLQGDSINITAYEIEIGKLVNTYRTQNGLTELQPAPAIFLEAKRHSANMAAGSTAFGHDGFSDRVTAIANRGFTVSGAAENVATGSPGSGGPSDAVARWIASPGHKANILGPYTYTGIGAVKSSNGVCYLTQIFIK